MRGGHLTAGTIRGLEADRAESVVGEVLGQTPDATFVAIFQAKDRASGGAPFSRSGTSRAGALARRAGGARGGHPSASGGSR